MAGHALQRLGRINQLFDLRVRLIALRQRLAQAQSVVQRDVQGVGNLLRNGIHFCVGDVHHPSHVPDYAPGGHGAECDNLGHVVVAVLAAHIIHHFSPAGISEVHIDIGHADPLRVQEPLKIEVVLHGVDIGDVEAVGDHGTGGASTTGADGNAHALRVLHKIGHNEKIVCKAHFLNHVLLIFQLFPVFGVLAVALPIALITELLQVRKAVIPRRKLKFRQMIGTKCEFQVASLRDFPCVLYSTLIVLKQRLHLLLRAEIKVLGLIAHPVLVVQRPSGLDAEQNIMGIRVCLMNIVGVIGADHGKPRLLVNPEQALVDDCLVPDAVILQLQIEVVRAEDVGQFQGVGLGVFVFPVPQHSGNLSGKAGREGNEAAAVLPQKVQVNPGLDIKALRPGHGYHIGEIAVSLLILTQQNHVAALRIKFMNLVKPGPPLGGHIDLTADDGLDALGQTGAIKINDAIHNAVVCDGTGGLPHLFDGFRQIPNPAGTVQKAVFSMDMQMHKRHGFPSPFTDTLRLLKPKNFLSDGSPLPEHLLHNLRCGDNHNVTVGGNAHPGRGGRLIADTGLGRQKLAAHRGVKRILKPAPEIPGQLIQRLFLLGFFRVLVGIEQAQRHQAAGNRAAELLMAASDTAAERAGDRHSLLIGETGEIRKGG